MDHFLLVEAATNPLAHTQNNKYKLFYNILSLNSEMVNDVD